MFEIVSIQDDFILCSGGESSYIVRFIFMMYTIGMVFSGKKDKINSPDFIPNAVGLEFIWRTGRWAQVIRGREKFKDMGWSVLW